VAINIKARLSISRTTAGLILSVGATITPFQAFGQSNVEPDNAEPIVEPVENWLKFHEVTYQGQHLILHLRTGYGRPVIFPEPIIVPDEISISGLQFEVDIDILVFSPTNHFKTAEFSVIGQRTGTVYKFRIKSDPIGQRIPLEIRLR